MNILEGFIVGARLKTLISSISPVLLGTVIAYDTKPLHFPLFLLTLLFALCVQIGMNFSNDYLDFLKGSDTTERIGPRRAVQSKLVSINVMRIATLGIFAMAGIIGIYLMQIGGWQIGVLALLAILLAYFYTGGPYPIGHLGWSDLCVLVFFGPIATAGTTYLQTATLSSISIIAGLAPGLFSTAMLAMNNVRDFEQDRKACKKTLPVRFGILFGKWEITCCLILPCLIPFYLFNRTYHHPLSLLSTSAFIFSLLFVRALFQKKNSALLFPKIGYIFTLYTLLFSLGWILS